MKKNAITEIVKQGKVALLAEVKRLQLELNQLKLNAVRGEVKNRRNGKIIRRTIARLLTQHTLLSRTTKEQV